MRTLRKLGTGLLMATLFMSLTAGGCSGDSDDDDPLVGNEIIKGVWTTTQKDAEQEVNIYTTYHISDGNKLYATRHIEPFGNSKAASSNQYLRGSWTLDETTGLLTLQVKEERTSVYEAWKKSDKEPASTYCTLSVKELKTLIDGLVYKKLDDNPIVGSWRVESVTLMDVNNVTGKPEEYEKVKADVTYKKDGSYNMTFTLSITDLDEEVIKTGTRDSRGTYKLTNNPNDGFTLHTEEEYWIWDNGDRYDGNTDELDDEDVSIDMYDGLFLYHPELDDDDDYDDNDVSFEGIFYRK